MTFNLWQRQKINDKCIAMKNHQTEKDTRNVTVFNPQSHSSGFLR